ncbi:MAG: DegV family protein [Ilumatobacteraceae bacterium]
MRSIERAVGLCTDSSARLPPDLVDRFRVAVVPATVHVDDRDYLEGIDIGADEYDAVVAAGATITTSEPSAGQFAVAYDELVARGCTEILSLHGAATVSGTVSAARLAAHRAGVPVRIIDTGTAGFGVACCVWAAAEALAAGATADEVTAHVESAAPRVGHVFVADPASWCDDALLVQPGGVDDPTGSISVLGVRDGALELVGCVIGNQDAIDTMVDRVVELGTGLRVGVGMADRAMADLVDGLEAALRAHPAVDEVVRYRIGPSVGAHVGRRTVGCFTLPRVLGQSTPAAS